MAEQEVAGSGWKFPESYDEVMDYVDKTDPNLLYCVLVIPWVPFYWNLVCRLEYNTQVFSKLFGSAKVACFCLSFTQIFCSNLRNFYYKETLQSQPKFETPFNEVLTYVGYGFIVLGTLFVVTSFLRLGWFGTWHGDHFGIYLDAKVTSFPYNVLEHPMHTGGVLNFLGSALILRSITGIIMTFWLQIVYKVVENFVEGPFTEMIYARKAEADKKKAHKSK